MDAIPISVVKETIKEKVKIENIVPSLLHVAERKTKIKVLWYYVVIL